MAKPRRICGTPPGEVVSIQRFECSMGRLVFPLESAAGCGAAKLSSIRAGSGFSGDGRLPLAQNCFGGAGVASSQQAGCQPAEANWITAAGLVGVFQIRHRAIPLLLNGQTGTAHRVSQRFVLSFAGQQAIGLRHGFAPAIVLDVQIDQMPPQPLGTMMLCSGRFENLTGLRRATLQIEPRL